MRVGDLLHARVVDASGHAVGRVFDIHAVRSGPLASESQGFGLQIAALLVGKGAMLLRLGYHHRDVKGPALLRGLALRLPSYRVQWSDVAAVEEHRIVLHVSREELKRGTDPDQ